LYYLKKIKELTMLKVKRKVGIIFFPAYDWAISPSHPEREERLLYTQDQIKEEGLFDIDGINEYKPLIANDFQINRAHVCVPDVETQASISHRISAGGALKAAQLIMEKSVDSAFALVRPPGHHARRIVHGNRGFCNINIEAVMIEELRKKYNIKKIAVVDTDCHHGDGTQDIYYHDPDVLFISLHQDGRTLYPGSGFTNELGIGKGYGYTLNVPLPPNTSDNGYLYVMENLVLPVLEDFQPEIIINSAGQDNHFTDPITNMNLTARGYAKLNDLLKPHIAVLEGGYSVEGALPYVNTGIILALAGLDYSHVIEPDFNESQLIEGESILKRIRQTVQELRGKWQIREELRKMHINNKELITTKRSVYYDESGITEYQNENLFICENCTSFYIMESSSDYYKICAFVLEHNICDKCRVKAEELYNNLHKNKFDYIYWHDKSSDDYRKITGF
jgi:acetoin utilization deacetylase AcuC-like enzyme